MFKSLTIDDLIRIVDVMGYEHNQISPISMAHFLKINDIKLVITEGYYELKFDSQNKELLFRIKYGLEV